MIKIKMIKIKILIAAGFFACTSLISCQKELGAEGVIDPPVTPPSGVSDSNFIALIYAVDSVGTTEDTTQTYTYKYDNLKRVINIIDSSQVGNGAWVLFATETFYYNGSDTLPYKYYKTVAEDANRDTTTRYLYYDLTGKRIKDSSYRIADNNNPGNTTTDYELRATVSTYDYQPGKIYGASVVAYATHMTNGTIISSTSVIRDSATINADGNITASIHNRAGQTRTARLLTYDNRPSVYAKINIGRSYNIFPDGRPTLFQWSGNNPLNYSSVTTGALNNFRNFNFAYTYLPDGRLKALSWSDGNAGNFEKFIFTYTSL